MRMHAFHGKRHKAFFLFRIRTSYNMDERKFFHAFYRAGDKFLFLCPYLVKPDAFDITDSRHQAHGAFHILRPRLKLGRKFRIGAFLLIYIFNHIAAQKERFHVLQQFFSAVKNADTAHRAHLMPGKREKITAELLHIHLFMGSTLRTVKNNHRPVFMRPTD